MVEWFDMTFIGGDYRYLAARAEGYAASGASVIVRNASYFRSIVTGVPQISMLQDINLSGYIREVQDAVLASSSIVAFNNPFTAAKYDAALAPKIRLIPLGVDFSLFERRRDPALMIPEGAVCWIGASAGAEGPYKGFPMFMSIVRRNPDIEFVGVFKDAAPAHTPRNLRTFTKIPHNVLVGVIGSCSVALCTSDPSNNPVENQHIAGIEMGACGLPMVAPKVGNYWHRADDMPGEVVREHDVTCYSDALRRVLSGPIDRAGIRAYWQGDFDKPVVRGMWEEAILSVEAP